MKPLFTVHAGEYLVGSFIEQKFKDAEVWVPTRDTGIDLLVTRKKRQVSIQVKYSHDYPIKHVDSTLQHNFIASGWWVLSLKKIRVSRADIWCFILVSFDRKKTQYILIPPKVLYSRLTKIHGKDDRVHIYFTVTKKGKCWETRGLNKVDWIPIVNNAYKNPVRDFTEYLNCWDRLGSRR